VTPPLDPTQARHYVRWVIDAYLHLPDTPRRARDHDHHLAAQLHQRGVPVAMIEAAFLLATLRRIHRPPDATPLTPIRSLHYFLPIIDELLQSPTSPSYLRYLRERVAETISSGRADASSKKITST
jgi:hypothetical protein